MIKVAFYDTRPYDKIAFEKNEESRQLAWAFHDFRLSSETVATAKGASAVCVFVNDKLDRTCLEKLSALGIKLIALRCAGFNNVDLEAANKLQFKVIRVPAY